MAATFEKPTEVMRYGDQATNKSEPSAAQKDDGAVLNGIANSSHLNWNSENIGDWLAWFNERIFDGPITGGEPEDFMLMVPGETADSFLYWDNSEQTLFFEHDLMPAGTVSLGDATNDWENVYTKTLFVENLPIVAARLDTAITNLAQSTARSILPSDSDTTTIATFFSVTSSRQFTLAAAQPAGRYEITYNVRLANAASNMEVSFRPVVNGTPLSTAYSIILTSIIASAAYGPTQTLNWFIDLATGDTFQIEATQLDSGADSAILIGSHATMKLVRPDYV